MLKVLTKVKLDPSASQMQSHCIRHFAIMETGLPICALEKMAGKLAKRVGQDIFSSPVGGPEIAKLPRFVAISNSNAA
jgi:hypothetical protein